MLRVNLSKKYLDIFVYPSLTYLTCTFTNIFCGEERSKMSTSISINCFMLFQLKDWFKDSFPFCNYFVDIYHGNTFMYS